MVIVSLSVMLSVILLITIDCHKGTEPTQVSVPDITASEEHTITDIDGNVYRTIRIGDQEWMSENLKTTRYNDGQPIPNITDNSQWVNLTTPGYCWYNNNLSNKEIYGGLYNWYAVSAGNLAPEGWHVPSEAEWVSLIQFLGGEAIAGSRLEQMGFTAQGAGQRTSDFGIFNMSPDLDKY